MTLAVALGLSAVSFAVGWYASRRAAWEREHLAIDRARRITEVASEVAISRGVSMDDAMRSIENAMRMGKR